MLLWCRRRSTKTIVISVLVVLTGLFTVMLSKAFAIWTKDWSGARFMVVLSGSMQPALREGDMIIVIPEGKSSYKKGDILSYQESEKSRIITHRVVAVLQEGQQTCYLTKGDANQWPDREPVTEDKVLGRVKYRIPHLGKALAFVKMTR